MQKKNRYLTLLILLFLILSACSEDQGTGPSLIEISSDEDIKQDEDSDEDEDLDEDENKDSDEDEDCLLYTSPSPRD